MRAKRDAGEIQRRERSAQEIYKGMAAAVDLRALTREKGEAGESEGRGSRAAHPAEREAK
jgi:hypothetical protein